MGRGVTNSNDGFEESGVEQTAFDRGYSKEGFYVHTERAYRTCIQNVG
jgi:hypothetical protein